MRQPANFHPTRRRRWLCFAGGLLAGLWLALPRLALAEAGSFRFAWLSDTHVGSSTAAEDLRATVSDINSLTGLSFVVVSGDVTEYGSWEQLRLAREILGELKVPCHVIPGNHDTKWSESGATDFARLWQEDRFVFDFGGFKFVGLHQGPVMRMGDGHWAPQDVRWLRQTLATMPDPRQPLIFVTHYPLDAGIDNWYVVLDLLKQYNIQAVLCGHGHANHKYLFEGVPGVMGRSNLRARNPVGGFNLVEVGNGRLVCSERVTGRETKPAWNEVVLCQHDFASDTNRYPRPDFSANRTFSLVKEKWAVDTGYTIASTPALWRKTAIVGDASGTVYALSVGAGTTNWTFKTGRAVYSSPAVSRGIVVVPSTDGKIYALDAAKGRLLWQNETPRPIVASPVIADGRVFVGSSDGKFRALKVSTGARVWEFAGVNGFVESRPLAWDGQVIFGAWDEHLYALTAKAGTLAWKWRGDRPGTLLSPAACWPVGAHGKVFIVAPDRRMTCLDAKTGAQIWRTGDYVVRESIGISEDGSRFYVRAMNDFFYAFSTSATRPAKLWETNAHFGYDINSAMLVEKNGVVFYGTKNGLVFALDAKTGAVLWQHKIGVGLVNTLLPLSGTEVLATDFDGKIVLLHGPKT